MPDALGDHPRHARAATRAAGAGRPGAVVLVTSSDDRHEPGDLHDGQRAGRAVTSVGHAGQLDPARRAAGGERAGADRAHRSRSRPRTARVPASRPGRRRASRRRTRTRAARCPARGRRPAARRRPRTSANESAKTSSDHRPERRPRPTAARTGRRPHESDSPPVGSSSASTTKPWSDAASPTSARVRPRSSGSSTRDRDPQADREPPQRQQARGNRRPGRVHGVSPGSAASRTRCTDDLAAPGLGSSPRFPGTARSTAFELGP